MNMPGRNMAFGQGQAGDSTRVGSSLAADSARFNDSVGKDFTPMSVLNQSNPSSGNGMSSTDFSQRTLTNGAQLPSVNGDSADTYKGDVGLLLDGKPLMSPL
jgi:hypothetical protein